MDGIVFEKDLGPKTTAAAPAIAEFSPDASWGPLRNERCIGSLAQPLATSGDVGPSETTKWATPTL